MAHKKTVIELKEAQKALELMLAEASKEPHRPMAFAIADDQGELIVYARMDKCPLLSQMVARKKAYTSSRMRSDSGTLGDGVKKMGWQLVDFGDPNLIGIAGGVAIREADGAVIGAVGASGRMPQEDDALAKLGLTAFSELTG